MPASNKKKKRLLIVDDEIVVRNTLSKILSDCGYDVFCVEDGQTALNIIKEDSYDLILLDLKLDGMDGLKMLELLRKTNKEIPVILISGYLTIENIEEASKYKIFSYIRKPFKIIDLREKVRRAIQNGKK